MFIFNIRNNSIHRSSSIEYKLTEDNGNDVGVFSQSNAKRAVRSRSEKLIQNVIDQVSIFIRD